MTSRSEIRKFVDAHFGGPTKAAEVIGLHYLTVRRWETEPERMLLHIWNISELCDATPEDILATVQAQRERNENGDV